MRDEATIDAILSNIRKLWLLDDSTSVCRLIYYSVDPAVDNEEILQFSDKALLQSLKSRLFFWTEDSKNPNTVSAEHLAALDKARDYDAASTYNWLNAELRKLLDVIRSGGVISIENEEKTISFSTESSFVSWAKKRYPATDLDEPKSVTAITIPVPERKWWQFWL